MNFVPCGGFITVCAYQNSPSQPIAAALRRHAGMMSEDFLVEVTRTTGCLLTSWRKCVVPGFEFSWKDWTRSHVLTCRSSSLARADLLSGMLTNPELLTAFSNSAKMSCSRKTQLVTRQADFTRTQKKGTAGVCTGPSEMQCTNRAGHCDSYKTALTDWCVYVPAMMSRNLSFVAGGMKQCHSDHDETTYWLVCSVKVTGGTGSPRQSSPASEEDSSVFEQDWLNQIVLTTDSQVFITSIPSSPRLCDVALTFIILHTTVQPKTGPRFMDGLFNFWIAGGYWEHRLLTTV